MQKSILYNTSFFIEKGIEEEFVKWVKNNWVNLLEEDKRVEKSYFSKIHVVREDDFINYSLLIHIDLADIESYKSGVEAHILGVMSETFGKKAMHMSTIMEIL